MTDRAPSSNGNAKGRGRATVKSGIAQRRDAAKAEGGEQYMARRRDVVKAAANVFREKGFAGTAVDDIARVAGMDRATLYYYVGNKNELFKEVVMHAVVNNITLAEQIAETSEDPAVKLHKLIDGVMDSYATFYPHLFVFIQEEAGSIESAPDSDFDVAELSRRFDRALISILKDGVESGVFRNDVSPRLAAYGIVGMLNWTHRWFDPDGPVPSDEVAKAFAAVAVEGLLKR